jgi:hypothetical protein
VLVHAVEQTPVSLDDADVGSKRFMEEYGTDTIPRMEKRIQVGTGAIGCQGEPLGVDVVRSLLEWGNYFACPAEGTHKGQGNNGFSRAAGQASKKYAWIEILQDIDVVIN